MPDEACLREQAVLHVRWFAAWEFERTEGVM
jgi:hypothetical protein